MAHLQAWPVLPAPQTLTEAVDQLAMLAGALSTLPEWSGDNDG